MLTIRPEQLKTFAEAGRRDFERRAARHLAREHPDFCRERGEDAVLALVRRTARRARAYGVGTEVGVVVLARLSILYGENFYRDEAWAAHILTHADLDAGAKVARLSEYLPDEQDGPTSDEPDDGPQPGEPAG